jgi:hypothetical protein
VPTLYYLCQLTKKYEYDSTTGLQTADLILPQALERDWGGGQCIITEMGVGVESTHIYPYSLRSVSGPTCSRFWTALAMFWPPSTIEEWKRDVSGGGDTEPCANRITLSPNAHAYWVRCLFALKPVALSQDQKCLELEFHWLRSVPRSDTVLLTSKPSLLESLDGSVDNAGLFDPSTNSRILSGRRYGWKRMTLSISPFPPSSCCSSTGLCKDWQHSVVL